CSLHYIHITIHDLVHVLPLHTFHTRRSSDLAISIRILRVRLTSLASPRKTRWLPRVKMSASTVSSTILRFSSAGPEMASTASGGSSRVELATRGRGDCAAWAPLGRTL